MKKKALKTAGYIFFTLCTFVAFLFLIFPYDSLGKFVSQLIKKKTGANIEIKSIHPLLPIGLLADNIFVLNTDGGLLYNLDTVEASVMIKSLLKLSPKIYYALKRDASVFSGYLQKDNDNKNFIKLDFNLESAGLGSLYPKWNRKAVKGYLSVNGIVKFPMNKLGVANVMWVDLLEKGELTIKIHDAVVPISSIPFPGFSDIHFDEIKGKGELSMGRILVNSLEFKGDIKGTLKGNIVLMPYLPESRLDLRIKVMPSNDMKKKIGSFISIFNNKRDRDGYFNINLKGTFSRPKPIF